MQRFRSIMALLIVVVFFFNTINANGAYKVLAEAINSEDEAPIEITEEQQLEALEEIESIVDQVQQESPAPVVNTSAATVKDAGVTDNQVTIKPNTYYEIRNTSTKSVTLHYVADNYARYSYVQYLKNGSYSSAKDTWGTITLDVGEWAVVTATKNQAITFSVAANEMAGLTVKETKNPLFHEFTLAANKHYTIKNKQAKDIKVETDAGSSVRYDVIYYLNDVIHSTGQDTWGYLYIYANSVAKVSMSATADTTFYVPYEWRDLIEVKETDQPTYYYFTFEQNKNYVIQNTGSKLLFLSSTEGSNKRYDLIQYNGEKINNVLKNTWGSFSVYANSEARVSFYADATTNYYIPYELKDTLQIKEVEMPTFYKFTLDGQKHYKIENTSLDNVRIYSSASSDKKYDLVQYEQDELYDIQRNKGESFSVLANSHVNISQHADGVAEYYIPFEQKEALKISEVATPTLYEFTLEVNKHYEFENVTDQIRLLRNTSSSDAKYDLVKYQDEQLAALWQSTHGQFTLLPNSKARVSVGAEKEILFYVPYELKDTFKVSETKTPALYEFTLEANKHYELKNLTEQSISLKNTNNSKYDLTKYNKEKFYAVWKSTWGDFTLFAGSHANLSVKDDKALKFYVPYELKDQFKVTEAKTPALYEFTLEKGKNYEVKNLSEESVELERASGYQAQYDIVNYTGDKQRYVDQSRYGSFNLNTKGHARLSIYPNKEVSFYVPYEFKDYIVVSEAAIPAFYKFSLEKGKHYELANTSDQVMDLNNSTGYDGKYDIVNYTDSKLRYYEQRRYGSFNLNANSQARVSVTGNYVLNYYIPYELKDSLKVTEVQVPALNEVTLKPDTSYKVMNKTGQSINVMNTSSYSLRYDMLFYKVDGQYKLYEKDYGAVTLQSKDYFFISYATHGTDMLKMYYPYEWHQQGLVIQESDSEYENYFDILPKVNVDLTKVLAKTAAEKETVSVKDSLSNYKFTVKNKTQNKSVINFTVQDTYIVFAQNSVNAGDELELTLTSRTKDTAEKTVTVKLNDKAQLEQKIELTELAKIKASEKTASTQAATPRMLVFDAQGKRIEMKSGKNGEPLVSMPLLKGTYTVVLLKAEGVLWQVDQLQELASRGLKENSDYVKQQLAVVDGKISEFTPEKIPVLNEAALSYFDRTNTLFTTNTDSVVQGGLLEVRLQYQFKNSYTSANISNHSLQIALPDEVAFVEGSVVLDNVQTNYKINNTGTLLTIPTTKTNGIVKFYVKPLESQNVQLKATSNFIYQNKSVTEVLGLADVSVQYITMNGPKETSSKQITVHGVALPNTKLSIYEGTKVISEVTVPKSGKWSKQVTLSNTQTGSSIELYAQAGNQQSNKITVQYLYKAPSLNSATLVHNGSSKNVSGAFLKGTKEVITINPVHPFTFKIKMDNGDVITKLFVTSTRNQEKKALEAKYDAKTGYWIASGYFDPNNHQYVPGAINIEYETKREKIDLNSQVDFTKEQYTSALPKSFEGAKVEVIEKTASKVSTVIELNDAEKTKIESIETTKAIATNITKTGLVNSGYTKVNDNVYVRYDIAKDRVSQKTYDFEKNLEKQATLQLIDIVPGGKPIAAIFGVKDSLINIGDTFVDAVVLERSIMNSNLSAEEKKQQLEKLALLTTVNMSYNMFKIGYTTMAVAGLINPGGAAIVITIFVADQLIEILYENGLKSLLENGTIFGWLIDPSGFVYEAVPANRLKGVKATVYYKDPETGKEVLWNAEEFDQKNPLITDDQGVYAWDVPEGFWQVKYELEGYETAYSGWLPVPPPQTTVNVGLVSKKQPEVKDVVFEETHAEVTFEKYMSVTSVTAATVLLKDAQGKNIAKKIEAIGAEKNEAGNLLAKQFKITYADGTVLKDKDALQLEVKKGVLTYANIGLTNDLAVKKNYAKIQQNIVAPEQLELKYGEATQVVIQLADSTNAKAAKVRIESKLNDIAEPVTNSVQVNDKGQATINIRGNLPGETSLILTLEGTTITKEIKVNVLQVGVAVPNQKPSISAQDIVVNVGDKLDLFAGVVAQDPEDGILTPKIIKNTVDLTKAGTYEVVYEVTDSKGEKATQAVKVIVNIVVDKTPPTAPIVNTVTDAVTVITGKAETGTTVYATVAGKEIGKAIAKNNSYSITIKPQKANTIITVYAVDASGNESERSTIKVIDKTPPAVPTVNTVSDAVVAVTGKAETGAKVYAMIGTKKLGEATAKNGAYSIKIAKQKAGTAISVYAVDAAGNKGKSTTTKVVDKTAPAIPTVNAVYDNATKVTGKAEKNAVVYVMAGTKKLGQATAVNGTFSIKIAKQKAGVSLTVYAVDAAKNKGKSKVVKVIDKTPPVISAVNKVTSKTVSVSGKAEKGAVITIYVGNKKIGQATVDTKGNFKVKIKAQKKGVTLNIYAQDKALNKSKAKAVKVN